ncbi:HVO_A0114 family putative DNA-binding protein [Duganella sp. S19_KUP01_CR8]|uniref:HVO_A0114 family putative DNA-binding protein n=1 Tax=Duganella sp. S19_KUP01_CR8 TaxID=3025502 RepID=UPI003FA5CA34
MMKPIFIGIMPQEKIRERVLAIARGSYKPKPNEPKVWFTSMKSLAEVLSDENRALLHVILETQPESISALAEATGRKPSNLSRTLKTMSNYGIVELIRERNLVRPVAKATEFRIVAH